MKLKFDIADVVRSNAIRKGVRYQNELRESVRIKS